MIRRRLLISVLAGCSAAPWATAGQELTCTDAVHREFDFWIGDWDVEQEFRMSDGTVVRLPARSTVTRELKGCSLLERWQGQVQYSWEGMTEPDSLHAISVRAFDDVDGVWRIHWMDTRAPRRWVAGGFTGRFEGGVGTFLSPANSEGWSATRIRFFGVRPDAVEWELSSRQAAGGPWQVIWKMHFRRR